MALWLRSRSWVIPARNSSIPTIQTKLPGLSLQWSRPNYQGYPYNDPDQTTWAIPTIQSEQTTLAALTTNDFVFAIEKFVWKVGLARRRTLVNKGGMGGGDSKRLHYWFPWDTKPHKLGFYLWHYRFILFYWWKVFFFVFNLWRF